MPVYIYRLIGAGTVEGQIIRRQLFKNSLAKVIAAYPRDRTIAIQVLLQTFVDGREGTKGSWAAEHLKDLLRPICGRCATVDQPVCPYDLVSRFKQPERWQK